MDCKCKEKNSNQTLKRNPNLLFSELSNKITFAISFLFSGLNNIKSLYCYNKSYKSLLTPKEFMSEYITNNYADANLMRRHLYNIKDYVWPMSIRDLYPKHMSYNEMILYFFHLISHWWYISWKNIYINKLFPKGIRMSAELHELSHLSDSSWGCLPDWFSSTYIDNDWWVSALDDFLFQPTDIYADYDILYPNNTPKNKLKIIKKINHLSDPTEVRARFIQSLAKFDKRNEKLTRREFEIVWNEWFFGLKAAVKDKEKFWQFLQRDDVY